MTPNQYELTRRTEQVMHIVDRLIVDGVSSLQALHMPQTQRNAIMEAVGYEGVVDLKTWNEVVRQLEYAEQRMSCGEQSLVTDPPVYPDIMSGCMDRCHWHGLIYFHDVQCLNAPANRMHL